MNSINQQYEDAVLSGNQGLGLQLATQYAESRGFNIPAYHGTFQNFNEFKEHDIGFHFSKCVYVAQNRLDDKFDDCDYTNPEIILHVALSMHNPMTVNADVGSWNAKDLLDAASYKYTGTPFMPPSTMYLYEQKSWARAAHRILKSIGIDRESALEMKCRLDRDPKLNPETTEFLRQRCIESPYDGIIYPNDFESQEGCDSTCYIVFSPNQIKSLEPVYGSDGKLTPLSQRFDISSSKFR